MRRRIEDVRVRESDEGVSVDGNESDRIASSGERMLWLDDTASSDVDDMHGM